MKIKDMILRSLPSIEKLISHEQCSPLVEKYGRNLVVQTLRKLLETFREEILSDDATTKNHDVEDHHWIKKAEKLLTTGAKPNLRKVLNLSGVIVHTNLGRSLLADEAVKAAMVAAESHVNLEYDIEKGKRGDRDDLIENLIVELTGAEAATCINNNAAAVLLALNTISDGQETIISRGEIVEIGGSFRIHEIMKKSGCDLVEVGTTNRTHLPDYENAISENTALILKAHTSNYKVIGFTATPPLSSLCDLAKSKNLPVMVDLGSGALLHLPVFGKDGGPTVRETITAGADIVTFSCDKLLGGPQAGIIAGSKNLIDQIKKNNLKRALRVDKMTLAALEATLLLYRNSEKAMRDIPTLRHLTKELDEVRKTANMAVEVLSGWFGHDTEINVTDDVAQAGAGSAPQREIPSISITIKSKTKSPDKLAEWFRSLKTPIIGRIEHDIFKLDMRCLDNIEELRTAR